MKSPSACDERRKTYMKSTLAFSLLFLGVTSHTSMAQSVGRFSRTGDLTTARQLHTATLLTNGKVLIAGGFTAPNPLPAHVSSFPVHASAELYDPSTRTFTST